MNGLVPLTGILATAGIAKSAVASLGKAAASLTDVVTKSSFAETLAGESSSPSVSVQQTREKLTSAIEQVLTRLGVGLDPPVLFNADDDGYLQLERDHPRAAEIEANLNENASIQELVAQLVHTGTAADRHLVLHSVSGT